MDAWGPGSFAVLVMLGFVAGIVSFVVSLASVVSYPALLALGLPPVAANVTNTVSLVFSGIGAALGSRRELAGQRRRVLLLGMLAATGGALGALLLLRIPPEGFAASVPVIIASASLLILVQPRLSVRVRTGGVARWWFAAVLGAAVYIGYFGAAGGVLMLAALGGVLRDELARLNALKNVLGCFANAVAAIGFTWFGPVQWAVVVPLATGFLVGGWVGPGIARRLPAAVLRRLIVASGFAVAAVLAVRTYHLA